MRRAPVSVLVSILGVLALCGCKREAQPETHGQGTAPPPAHDAAVAAGAAVAGKEPIWFRAIIRTADGVEARFFLGVPPPGAPGQAVFRVGNHEVRSEATFDGKTLNVPLAVHMTSVDATVGQDGSLSGSFSASWRAFGTSSIPLTATKVAAPAVSALATVASDAAVIDLGEPRSIWQITMTEAGTVKLTLDQTAPGEFTGLLLLDTGNIIYVAGNGRGDTIIMTGFDGTAAYRLELELAGDRTHASGKFFGGHRFDWREPLTATRVADFTLALKPKAKQPGIKIELPDSPELAALGNRPLVVEMGGSWCSTCRSAAPFFVELYREFQPRGLGMVTLLYEFSDDREIDAKQAKAFKKTYGVTWPVVPVQGGPDDFLEIIPSGLADLNPSGFPITLFLAADRSLVALHAGFPAADTSSEFRRVASEYRANIEALLASPPDKGDARRPDRPRKQN
jgi:thiol-disulfide isomerase/thioredoxin